MLLGQKFPSKGLIVISGVCALFLGVAALSGFSDNRDHDRERGDDKRHKPPVHQPLVSWSPSSVTQNISAGDTTNISVYLTSSKNLNNVCLEISTQLKQIAELTPTNISALVKDQPVLVNISLHPSVIIPAKVFEGLIYVRTQDEAFPKCDRDDDGDRSKQTGNALPLSIRVTLATYTNAQLGVTLTYPDLGLSSQVDVVPVDADGTLLDIKFKSAFDTNYVSGFGVSLFKNPNHLSLPVWFQTYIDPKATLTTSGAFTNTKLANGVDALVLSGQIPADYLDEFGPVMPIYAISQSGNTIYSITQSQASELDTLGLSPAEISQMLRQVVTNLQAP